MLSRAHLLIQRELDELNNEPDITVVRKPGPESIFNLIALINGPRETIWSEGVFQVNIHLDETYNDRPPVECYFQTVPFHPNVHPQTGRPSLDFLEPEKWVPGRHSIALILKSLQHLLGNPLLDRAVNMEAVFILKGNPSQFERITRQTVLATQDIRKLVEVHRRKRFGNSDSDRIRVFEMPKKKGESTSEGISSRTASKRKETLEKLVSFDDYCQLWRGIATTKPSKNDENVYVSSTLQNKPHLLPQHVSISLPELEEHINRQLSQHKQLMYGRFEFTGERQGEKKTIRNKPINYNELLSKSKLNRKPMEKIQGQPDQKEDDYLNEDDMFEQEVDELINWTKSI